MAVAPLASGGRGGVTLPFEVSAAILPLAIRRADDYGDIRVWDIERGKVVIGRIVQETRRHFYALSWLREDRLQFRPRSFRHYREAVEYARRVGGDLEDIAMTPPTVDDAASRAPSFRETSALGSGFEAAISPW